jgi:hypothetical protein
MNIPILSGVLASPTGQILQDYPQNLIASVGANGIAAGTLSPVMGIAHWLDLGGLVRGMITWENTLYVVAGSKLLMVTEGGTQTILGDVGTDGLAVTLFYRDDRLAIVSNGDLFYLTSGTFAKVTSPNISNPLSGIYVDGFTMLTDGAYLYHSNLTDPTVFEETKYGSAEVDPDPVKLLLKVRNEPCAVGRYSLEFYQNVGASGFAFQRIYGAMVLKGTLGARTSCVFLDSVAFLGGGKNENTAVWLANNGSAIRLSTDGIESYFEKYEEGVLDDSVVEAVSLDGQELLLVHLPEETLCYNATASQKASQPCWSILTQSDEYEALGYPAHFITRCYDNWIVADNLTSRIGKLSKDVLTWFTDVLPVEYSFQTQWLFNDNLPTFVSQLELIHSISHPAGTLSDSLQTISLAYSDDGITWSRELTINLPKLGQRTKSIQWRKLGRVAQKRLVRFTWNSNINLCLIALNVKGDVQ